MHANRTAPETISQYIAEFPPSVRRVLQRVRRCIRRAMPDAKEGISYKMPTFTVDGRDVIYFAGWKQHYSIYPAGRALVAAFKDALAPYEVSGKGTIRFPLAEPVPEALIGAIAAFRATEAAAPRAVTRRRGPKRRAPLDR